MNVKQNKMKPIYNKAKKGDFIEFPCHYTKGLTLTGKVLTIYDNSVLVDLRVIPNFHELELEYHSTVIGHSKYTILS